MEVRRILASFNPDGFSADLAQCAVQLTQRFGAELVGFAAATPWPVTTGPDEAGVAATVYAEQLTDLEKQFDALEEQFRASLPAGLKAVWSQMVEVPERGVIAMGRSVDLVLMGQGTAGAKDRLMRSDPASVVLSLGRPVLVTGTGATRVLADRIVVGWKDTREARRAVVDALPFLKSASAVMVCAIEEGDFATAKHSLQDAVDWMKSHDINAAGDVLPKEDDGSAATLEKARADFQADLTVTGAYGHSRMREWLLGGMTRELLELGTSNRFISN